MVRYEGLLLAYPQIAQTDIENLEAAINKIIHEKEGSVLSFERWGKYRLAYPVSKNEYGVYFLVRFDIPEKTSALTDLKMLFETKLNTIILRNLFTRLSFDQPLAYQRPKSLEETPARESEGFSREDRRRDRDRGVDRERDFDVEEKDVMPVEEHIVA